ncbi:MAG: halocyanin domain-containing protein [Halorientalis sp.]
MERERSSDSDGSTASRRGVLRTAATGAAAAGVTAGATGTATAQQGTPSPDEMFDGWLAETTNFDGTVVDKTGQDSVTIGVGGNGLVFTPPAVRVDPGTTIVWEWQGGRHNVVGENRDFSSGEPTSEVGTTFEQTFQETGVVKYLCEPHAPIMHGVVVVGDVTLGGGGEGGEGGGHGGGELVLTDGLLAVGGALVLGVLSPILFAIHLSLNSDRVDDRSNSGDDELRRIESQD